MSLQPVYLSSKRIGRPVLCPTNDTQHRALPKAYTRCAVLARLAPPCLGLYCSVFRGCTVALSHKYGILGSCLLSAAKGACGPISPSCTAPYCLLHQHRLLPDRAGLPRWGRSKGTLQDGPHAAPCPK